MSDLTRYAFDGAEIRVHVDDHGEPWFVAADVCRELGHTNTTVAVSRLEDDERNTLNIAEGKRGNPMVSVISEPGLYSLIMSSRVEGAKRFKRWVTHEVLPAIRKTGSYAAQLLNDAGALRGLLLDYTERVIALEAKNQEQAHQLAEAAPKVEIHDRIVDCGDTLGFREAAKLIREATGAKEAEFRGLLLKRRWAQRLGGRLCPAHIGQERGYTAVREREWSDSTGARHFSPELRVTPKGVSRAIQVLLASAHMDNVDLEKGARE